MKIDLVRIGNSRGIRIPKPIIEQCGFGDSVELRIENNCLIVSPGKPPREGWEEAIRASRREDNDELLLDGIPPNEFDKKEWEW